jgi:hypothetical protein
MPLPGPVLCGFHVEQSVSKKPLVGVQMREVIPVLADKAEIAAQQHHGDQQHTHQHIAPRNGGGPVTALRPA